ncbi:hypothetical protein [Paraburkholderia saeva]|uniref:Uncharacterized protein n=1 Tax=Paraburkholderia saeva TaxID=2777537 RepID=A0A9N8X1L0_9BURK|nr:hypothetical protein [Paraburkholderia saeva]CAG4901309.1 hypothetical protein LMG31841_02977 [Paraburkholderia saeva]CAG4923579.1 hypothetical protein R52603_05178 [Paraburkholderia saeva]CAG4925731.1 hypothetical protein R70241_05401 [Paraburkholderia saeva]
MLPFLSLHALAAQRGDGLRPELKALFERHARLATGLTAAIEPVETESFSLVEGVVAGVPAKECSADGSSASDSCFRGSGR